MLRSHADERDAHVCMLRSHADEENTHASLRNTRTREPHGSTAEANARPCERRRGALPPNWHLEEPRSMPRPADPSADGLESSTDRLRLALGARSPRMSEAR
jgi:hypothetical protein